MQGMTAHRPPGCRRCGREAVVHEDPEAELPAVATRPDATLDIADPSTRLAVRARDFCTGPMTTLLGPDELLLGGRFPVTGLPTASASASSAAARRLPLTGVTREPGLLNPRRDCNLNGVTPETEETPVVDVTDDQGQAGGELTAADEQLLRELTERARAGGLKLTGEGGLLGRLTKMVVEGALKGELDDHLGYEKNDPAGRDGGNSRNGHRAKTVLTEAGPVELSVPRDRDSSFEPKIVAKRQRRLTGIDDLVISLSAKGLTHGEIAAHLAEIYGAEVSKQTITTITDRVMEGLADWQSRPLDAVYAVIFIDAINVKIREGQVANRPIYLALGVTADGERDMLGLWAGEHGDGEGFAKYWLRVLSEIKNRGVRDVCMVVCDGLKGLPDAVGAVWEKTIVQTCIVHYPDTVVMPIPARRRWRAGVPGLAVSA
jgi:Transposase, Mutator family